MPSQLINISELLLIGLRRSKYLLSRLLSQEFFFDIEGHE